jgi:hypothetical protein
MNHKRSLGRAIFAALAVAAFVVPAASAAIPEVGRCVKVANGAGAYRGAACITHETGRVGKYEWIPVTEAEKQKFTGAGSSIILLTAGHSTLTCVNANISGEYTGPKTATVEIEFQACTNAENKQCQTTPAQLTEIKSLPLEAELGFIKNQPPAIKVGLDLKPKSPLTALATYECGTATETARIEGSVIAQIKPINKMTTESNLLYKTTRAGAQVPESFEGGPKDTLSTTFMSGLESTTAPSSMSMTGESGTNASALEIKAKEA